MGDVTGDGKENDIDPFDCAIDHACAWRLQQAGGTRRSRGIQARGYGKGNFKDDPFVAAGRICPAV